MSVIGVAQDWLFRGYLEIGLYRFPETAPSGHGRTHINEYLPAGKSPASTCREFGMKLRLMEAILSPMLPI